MKTLIVPTDFSPVATNALNYAVDMAIAIDARILLLHVYQVPVAFSEVPVVTVSMDEMSKISEEKLEDQKNAIAGVSSGKINVDTESRLGDVVDELEKLCKSVLPFAVIMGTRGTSAVERLFMGSNTLTAIRHLTHPVIVVPPGADYSGIKQIGFACDFRQVIETTPVAVIKKIVREFNARLHVLNVDYHNRQFKSGSAEETLQLQTMLEDLKPEFHFITDPNIEHGIDEFAQNNQIDLIITIPKKHKLLQGIFSPSSTRKLVFHSQIPIMCLHE
jgi:nucleotide-binding universal stress UspA family protein